MDTVYQSNHVRYERRADRVVPVRVSKQWVTFGQEPKVQTKFIAVRVSELRNFPPADYTDCPEEEPWTSSQERVESRERLMGLYIKGADFLECQLCGGCVIERDHAQSACPGKVDEPLVREAGYNQPWLPSGDLSRLTAAQAAYSLDNANGFERVWFTARPSKVDNAANQVTQAIAALNAPVFRTPGQMPASVNKARRRSE